MVKFNIPGKMLHIDVQTVSKNYSAEGRELTMDEAEVELKNGGRIETTMQVNFDLGDELKDWLDKHNIKEYQFSVEGKPPEKMSYILEFKNTRDAVLFKMIWA